MKTGEYESNVFINCPFDDEFRPLFEAMVFCVFDCGFRARCAMEVDDSAAVRVAKIFDIIGECRFGVHDLSRTELDRHTGLPRFNMPFELGMFLGARRFGDKRQRSKACLVTDREPYRYQKFLSDIAGQDIQTHDDEPRRAVTVVRNWLQAAVKPRVLPSGGEIYDRYNRFRGDLPAACAPVRLRPDELTFVDLANVIAIWLEEQRALSKSAEGRDR
jgi:hypothetical protein